jgi:hypothetical protein
MGTPRHLKPPSAPNNLAFSGGAQALQRAVSQLILG